MDFPAAVWDVADAPDEARTLPAVAFTDPRVLAHERDTVFHHAWSLVPDATGDAYRADPRSTADLVRRRGARAPFNAFDRPLFLQRDWDGTLRAFPNVCTHAWHTLVTGPGRERHVTCPQHGRKFDCAGQYQSHPGFEDAAGIPSADDHLRAFAADEWGPFVFAATGQPRVDLATTLAPVAASLGSFDLTGLEREPHDAESRIVSGNWKLHAWNYLDSMHIPFIHRQPGGLADAVDLASYRTEVFDDAVLQWAFAKKEDDAFAPGALAPRFEANGQRAFALWWFVWPNLTLNFYPWGLSVNVYEPVPDRPRETRFRWLHYAADEAAYAARETRWFLGDVDAEDVDALAHVARGAASGLAPRGRFAGAAEAAPHWFHRRVSSALRATTPP